MGLLDWFIAALEGFQWDAGNPDRNWRRHSVRQVAAEQVPLSRPLVLVADVRHSQMEPRFVALGHTAAGRRLIVVFTVRGKLVRVISARSMSQAEQKAYAKSQTRPEGDF